MATSKKRGRPPSPLGKGVYVQARQLGRVPDEEWQLIRKACEVSGQSLVEWALPLLLKEAKRMIRETD